MTLYNKGSCPAYRPDLELQQTQLNFLTQVNLWKWSFCCGVIAHINSLHSRCDHRECRLQCIYKSRAWTLWLVGEVKKKRKLPASFSAANNPANYSACSKEKAVTEVRLFGFMLYSLQCAASLSRRCCTLLEDRAVPYRAGVVIAVNGRTSTWNAIRLAEKHRSVNQ